MTATVRVLLQQFPHSFSSAIFFDLCCIFINLIWLDMADTRQWTPMQATHDRRKSQDNSSTPRAKSTLTLKRFELLFHCPSWKTTPCQRSAPACSIYSPPPSTSGFRLPSPQPEDKPYGGMGEREWTKLAHDRHQ
jgi:hypothetical protein